MRIKGAKIPITITGYQKSNNLEMISEQIKGLGVVPDFGYNEKNIGDQNLNGWKMLFDYVKKDSRLEKLKNFVHKALEEKKEAEKI